MANKKKSGFKWVLILAVLIILAGGIFWFVKHRDETAVEYQTATITRGDLTQMVTATGTLNPVVKVQVGSQISGRISKLYADFNTTVTKGQIIAEIDPSTYQANVQRAEADLASAEASLELARVEARRAEQLYTNNLISSSEHDTAIANLHQAEASTKIRQAALDSTRVDLSRCTIYSPVDGVVISRDVDVGQTVAASLSAPVLFQIASDLTQMQIDANVAEADVGGVEEDQDVEFTVDAFPFRTFHGKVTQVRNSPLVVQNVVTYDSVIKVNNSDLKLKPGMTANVSIITERREDVVMIPNAALRFRPPENAVLQSPTNSASEFTGAAPSGTNQTAAAGAAGGPGAFGGRRGNRGPGGGGGFGAFGGEGGGRRQRAGSSAERRVVQTIYVLPGGTAQANAKDVKLKPVKVRLGISDGIFTEVIEGLNEGDVVVIGSNSPSAPQISGQNPFGGGPRGFRR